MEWEVARERRESCIYVPVGIHSSTQKGSGKSWLRP
eukprot:COSAG02_NODE_52356_length_308_cov_0.899522_1_plen_35_part_10